MNNSAIIPNKIECYLVPTIGVGPFRYGDSEDMLVKLFNLELCERACESATWRTYELPGQDLQLYFDDEEGDGLSRIGCFDHLYYKGNNLFGMKLDELRSLLGNEDEIGEVCDSQTPVEFYEFGLQVWLDQQGECESVMCNPKIEE